MKKYLFLATLAALTACSNEDEFSSKSGNEIRLPTVITPMTRATSQNLQSTQIVSGREVGIFSQGTKDDQLNTPWTVDNSGTLSTKNPLYWADGEVTITAYHPYNSGWGSAREYLFNVQTDQRKDNGYLNSDVLWAQETSSETTKSINLNFVHCMSKINVTLTSEDITDLSNAEISLCGTNTSVYFNPTTGELKAADTNSSVNDIAAATTTAEATASAIIVPQTVASGTAFVKIVLGADTYYYTLPSDKTFKSGNSYSYTLRLSASLQEITCVSDNITDWNDETIEGDVVKGENESGSTSRIQFNATQTEMTYSGELNGDDIKILRQMLGGSEFPESEHGSLQKLDISGATIVKGGGAYFESFYTENDIVGENMFKNCSNLTEIETPTGITEIKDKAFNFCSNLHTVVISEGATIIGNSAFEMCGNLTEAVLPQSLLRIERGAFHDTNLSRIQIPGNVESIGYLAFGSVKQLTETNVTLPESLKRIDDSAFSSTNISSINIPDGLEEFGRCVFEGCVNLTDVRISENHSLLKMVDGVLYDKNLERLIFVEKDVAEYVFLESVNDIEAGAFGGSKVTDITMPDRFTNIPSGTFRESELRSITLPSNLESISSSAFQQSKLNSITFPPKLKKIDHEAFQGTPLTKIVFSVNVSEIGISAFQDCQGLESVVIPDLVTNLSENVFRGCANLTEVTIGSSVTKINHNAFSGAPLSIVRCKSINPQSISLSSEWAGFSNDYKLSENAVLYVPSESFEAYKTSGWSQYFAAENIIAKTE